MPALLKNKIGFIIVVLPFLIATSTGFVTLFLTGFTPANILIVGGSVVLLSALFTAINLHCYMTFTKNRTKDLVKYLDHQLIPEQTLKSISLETDETTAAAKLINNLAKSYSQNNGRISDLTSSVSAEQEKLLWIMQNMSDPIIGLDLRMNIAFINPAAEKVLGLDATLSKGQAIDQLLKFSTTLGELPFKTIVPLRAPGFEGIVYSQNEIKVISLINNKEAFTNVITVQIKHGSAINLSCIITFHDITAEKQLEAMKLDFISMAAHELRTPLTSIKGYISVFIQENEKKLSEDQMMFIRRINNSTQQLAALIENLLGVSRVERGAMTITTQPMDWDQVLQQAFEQFEHRAQEKRIELTYIKPKTPLPTVQADNVRINEVINNFIANAINYTEPGGKVTIWTEFKNSYITAHVTDTGRGLPKEAVQHLFTKFYRVPGNLDTASKGNGLGLYISKAIVELHHGKIWASSAGLGKGSTFSFSLPIVETQGMDLNVLTKKL